MHRSSASFFACPADRGSLELTVYREVGDQVEEGLLQCTRCDQGYPVVQGVPRLILGELRDEPMDSAHVPHPREAGSAGAPPRRDPSTERTVATFTSKWDWFPTFGIGDPLHGEFWDTWTASKLGLETPAKLHQFIATKRCILDAGCGVGQKIRMMGTHSSGRVFGFDLSGAASHAYRNIREMPRVDVAQGDLFAPPFRERQFDFVICDGVLHHTHDTRAAFRSLVPLLEPGGMMCIHVYKRMNPVREFADGYIRDRFSSMTPEECWEACKSITGLGKALLETDAEVTVPEDIPVLGIKAGSYNLQRFFYYEILKCFWNDLFTFEENNQAVFDHYHPVYAHKQTEEEVVGWFEEVGLEEITVYRGSPNGISVTATAPTA